MIRTQLILITVTTWLVSQMPMPVHAIMIDDFDTGPDSVSVPPTSSTVAAASAIGLFRTLATVSGANGTALEVFAPVPGVLGHSSPVIGASASKVTWDANGAGLGGIDLTDGGTSNGIRLDVLSVDAGSINLSLMITDTGVGSSTLAIPGLVVGTQDFLFSALVGNVNLSIVNSIMLTINALVPIDVTFDLIDTIDVPPPTGVPEPSTNLLMVVGTALGLGFASRRRRRR